MLLVALGCSKGSEPGASDGTSGSVPPPPDPAQVAYEQVRAGFVQLGNALETLGEALSAAKTGQGSSDKILKEACASIGEYLDSAGSYLSDYTEPPATFEEFNAKFAENDDNRLKAIDAANDALHEMGEAKGILDDLLNDPKLEKKQVVLDLRDLMEDAEKDLRQAIPVMGGKVEGSTDVPEDMEEPVKSAQSG